MSAMSSAVQGCVASASSSREQRAAAPSAGRAPGPSRAPTLSSRISPRLHAGPASCQPPRRHVDCRVLATATVEPKSHTSVASVSLLLPAPYQQTVARPFSTRGLGLHSGEWVTVRVRPAPAGMGRYFVRVADGTIPEGEGVNAAPTTESAEAPFVPPTDELRIHASLSSVKQSAAGNLCTLLGEGAHGTIMTPEHLLSALEGCGVDNARIEIQGGGEMPLLDGSARDWVNLLQASGLAPAPAPAGDVAGPGTRPRLAWKPLAPFSVCERDAFVSFYPEARTRLTYGIDFKQKSTAIGKQWVSWAPAEDGPYATEIAAARTFTTLADARMALQRGLIKGGTERSALLADGDRYTNPPLRYDPDECARHKLLDLIGDLALAAEGGHAGLPQGHVVAYKAGHELHLRFGKAMLAAVAGQERVPAEVRPDAPGGAAAAGAARERAALR